MILLTGAAGFIGSNILKALNDQGRDDIICVDDLTDGRKMQLLAKRKFFYYCDYRDLDRVKTQNIHLSGIIHQGANSDTTERDGRAIMLANYTFSIDLLGLAKAAGCPFVYASSAAVYGPGNEHRPCIEKPEHENPTTPYAISKWAFDQYVRARTAYGSSHRVVGLRYFNVYGPGEQFKGRMASVAYHTMRAIIDGDCPKLFVGSDRIARDFVAVKDVAATALWALQHAPSGIYNVGTGQARTFTTLVQRCYDVAGEPAHVQHVPFPDELLGAYQLHTRANLLQLRAAGYASPFQSLEDGIAEYWNNFPLTR